MPKGKQRPTADTKPVTKKCPHCKQLTVRDGYGDYYHVETGHYICKHMKRHIK